MPTTTPCPPPRDARLRRRGMTLTELIVASSLSGMIMAAILSSVLMISRSGYLLNNYIDMEKEARNALETFAYDARVTENIRWTRASESASPTGVTLIAPGGAVWVEYSYDASLGELWRRDSTGNRRRIVTGIQSLTFTAYQYADGPGLQLIDPASTGTDSMNNLTKMLQISLSAVRSRTTLVDATNNVVSARYVLRNKQQTI